MIIEGLILAVTIKIVQTMNIIREEIIMRRGDRHLPVISTVSATETILLAILAIVRKVIVDHPFSINLDMRKLKEMITEVAMTEKDLLITDSKAPIRTGSLTKMKAAAAKDLQERAPQDSINPLLS